MKAIFGKLILGTIIAIILATTFSTLMTDKTIAPSNEHFLIALDISLASIYIADLISIVADVVRLFHSGD
jgi:hypothetical protein